ncbi:sulfur carrier protein ThiS [Prochlorococcus marinus]|uniref:DUF170 n=1 Tax=Prochlorococcus marinus (strain MIT 9211) TaxID=93059 RepID=A9BBN9_PROM4|nr:sulfur carrier protein ThiS [Prochlorococcus marinus]ABX09251.1 DUF170 [Prochlorococcus marinus str. MIT 9211]
MKITVNGLLKVFQNSSTPLSLSEVIKDLGHNPKLIVVEFNGIILPQQDWDNQAVKDGDNLEIVTIVGGGA